MSEDVKEILVDALVAPSVKECLATFLSEDKTVLDESFLKRRRGRPRKGSAAEPDDLPKTRFARVLGT